MKINKTGHEISSRSCPTEAIPVFSIFCVLSKANFRLVTFFLIIFVVQKQIVWIGDVTEKLKDNPFLSEKAFEVKCKLC